MTAGRPGVDAWVVGVDSGGSGLRLALARVGPDGAPVPAGGPLTAPPVRTGGGGIDAGHLLGLLLPPLRSLLADAAGAGAQVAAVCVGAAGMATLGGELRERLPGALRDAVGAGAVALAADAVTGYAGAVGERPGAVVAAGTGLIALGTDLTVWRRADGWGHLLGDCGGGAWIGRAGLEAALREHDGRNGGSKALLARAEAVFGPAAGLPGRVYPRGDRPAVLASFAPEVARCAAGESPDPVARDILRAAAREIADTAAAVRPAGGGDVALTGGLLGLGEPLLGPLREESARRLPGAAVTVAEGQPLAGALLIAAGLAAGRLRLPQDPALLRVTRAHGRADQANA